MTLCAISLMSCAASIGKQAPDAPSGDFCVQIEKAIGKGFHADPTRDTKETVAQADAINRLGVRLCHWRP